MYLFVCPLLNGFPKSKAKLIRKMTASNSSMSDWDDCSTSSMSSCLQEWDCLSQECGKRSSVVSLCSLSSDATHDMEASTVDVGNVLNNLSSLSLLSSSANHLSHLGRTNRMSFLVSIPDDVQGVLLFYKALEGRSSYTSFEVHGNTISIR
jgi:hypothetical protein